MKSSILILPVMLAVAACSEAGNKAPQADVATDVAATDARSEASEGTDAVAPRIGANVAPGVAFDYRYSFALPEAKIAETQSRHAAQCEALGIVRCRVTGMTFERGDGGSIAATLAFRLDPALAHSFARDATDIVTAADGRLADSRIEGQDAGSNIVQDDKSLAGIDAELRKIDAQLAIPNLSKEVRGRLVEQAAELRAQRKEIAQSRDGRVESIATTPVRFDYASSGAILGFDNASPVGRAARTASGSFSAMLEVVLTAFGALAPWVLLGGGVWWVVRRLRAKPVAPVE